jgi:hypothetical protein
MNDAFARSVAQLHEDAAKMPGLLDDAVQGTAFHAAALAELVAHLDTRRRRLNDGRGGGTPPIPDLLSALVPASDGVRGRLLAAARRGPGELAVALGKAARGPAHQPAAATPLEVETLDDAGRAATALLTQAHHEVEEVRAEDLMAGADPVQAAMVLAAVAVKLAREVMTEDDVTTWITELAVAWSVGGE